MKFADHLLGVVASRNLLFLFKLLLERSAIAREIHDELGQMLTALKIDVARLRPRIADPNPTVLDLLDSITGSLNLTIKTTQNIVAALRPLILDELGLIPTAVRSVFTVNPTKAQRCEYAFWPNPHPQRCIHAQHSDHR